MAISPDHERLCRMLCESIEQSALSPDEKTNLCGGLQFSLENTNGKTDTEKVQGTAVGVFLLFANLARLYLATAKAPPPDTWKRVIRDCQFAIVLLVLIVAVLLGFRPELAGLLQSLAGVAVAGAG